jgi:hypothetical protein
MKQQLEIPFKSAALYEAGQGYRYRGTIVQVAEVVDGRPVFKKWPNREDVAVDGGYAVRATAYDKVGP